MFKKYTEEEHGIAASQAVAVKVDSINGITCLDLKLGSLWRRVLNYAIENPGRRKSFEAHYGSVKVVGSRFLLQTAFYNKAKAKGVSDRLIDQVFVNNGSVIKLVGVESAMELLDLMTAAYSYAKDNGYNGTLEFRITGRINGEVGEVVIVLG